MQESKDLFAFYGYDANSAVAFLETYFNTTNRNQLSDSQLKELINKLHDKHVRRPPIDIAAITN